MEFADSIILNSFHVNQVLDTKKYDRYRWTKYDSWSLQCKQQSLDSRYNRLHQSEVHSNISPPILDKCFKSWCTYYNSRKDKDDITWTIRKVDHPLQMDNFNCGVFVIRYRDDTYIHVYLCIITIYISLYVIKEYNYNY